MTGYEKIRYIIKHFIIVHFVFVLFVIYRYFFVSFLTYTHGGPSENARWLVPTCLIFPLFYLLLSVYKTFKKDFFKAIVMFFMFLYFILIPWIMTYKDTFSYTKSYYKDMFLNSKFL